MLCVICGRDINAIGQDNVSSIFGSPMCEDCGCSGDDSWEYSAFEEDFELPTIKMMGGRNRNYEQTVKNMGK